MSAVARTSKRADDKFSLSADVIEPLVKFYTDAVKFVDACEAPNAQFVDVAKATLGGFLIMGAVGYIVKLVHIPINQILVGA